MILRIKRRTNGILCIELLIESALHVSVSTWEQMIDILSRAMIRYPIYQKSMADPLTNALLDVTSSACGSVQLNWLEPFNVLCNQYISTIHKIAQLQGLVPFPYLYWKTCIWRRRIFYWSCMGDQRGRFSWERFDPDCCRARIQNQPIPENWHYS